MNDELPNSFFKVLTEAEAKEYRQWARDNYELNSPISGCWHPVIREECKRLNNKTQEGLMNSIRETLTK